MVGAGSEEKTAIKKKTLNPVWNETFTFSLSHFAQLKRTTVNLEFKVFDWDKCSKDVSIASGRHS